MLGKRRTKVFLTGALTIALLFALTMGAFAATGTTKSLAAIFRNIKININGSALQTQEEPFIVNGRTYVPLRVIGEALGAIVNWDAATNSVNITGNDVQEQMEKKDAEIARLKAEIEALKNGKPTVEGPEAEKSLLDLTEKMLKEYDELNEVDIDDIRFTGNEEYININIDVDLDDYDDEWDNLTDSKIKSWVSALCLDVQSYYSEDTEIVGKIKDIDSKDTLVEFSKYRTQAMKITYKDGDYRDGSGMDLYDLKDELEGQFYDIAGFRFKLESVNYDTRDEEIRLSFDGKDVTSKDWNAADPSEIKAATKKICKAIANTYVEDATEDPETVYVKFYDKIRNVLETWEYDVKDELLK